MSEQKENIEKIFREALQSHEVPVGPEVWASIQSSLTGLTTASSATGGSLFLGKAAAVIGFAGLITAATIAEVEYHNSENNSSNEIVVSDNDDKIETSQQAASFEEEREVAEKAELNIEVSSDKEQSASHSEVEAVAVNAKNGASAGEKQKNSFEATTAASESTVEASSNNEAAESSPSHSKESSSPSKTDSKDEIAEARSDQAPQSNEEIEEVIQEKTTAYFTHSAEQVITPNGDPYNEYFEVDGYGVRDFILRIMTRGGQLVFESNDISVRWNGVDRFGNPLPSGIYFYEIQAVGEDNLQYLEKNAKGSITIVRN
jgi:gliding motility-associated-like protein